MKAKEIRAANKEELSLRLHELKKDLMKLNSEVAVSNPKSPGKIRKIKRAIARILTISSEIQKKKEVKT